MRMLATIALMAAAGTAWAAPAPADAPPMSVIKAAIKAAGGEEALNKFKGGSLNMKGEMSLMGLDIDFEGKMIYDRSDKFKMNISIDLMGQKIAVEQILNGKKMKATMNGKDLELKDHDVEQLKANVAEQEITQLTPLLDAKKYTLKAGDDEDVDGKKAEVVIINGKAEGSVIKDMKLYFDKSTHLLVKTYKKDKDESDKEIDEESFYEDYKAVQGIMTAHKGVVKHDGKDYMKYTMSDVKYLEKVDDKEFTVDD